MSPGLVYHGVSAFSDQGPPPGVQADDSLVMAPQAISGLQEAEVMKSLPDLVLPIFRS